MSKYGTIAVCAAKKVREGNGLCPISAWKTSAEEIFPEQTASRENDGVPLTVEGGGSGESPC